MTKNKKGGLFQLIAYIIFFIFGDWEALMVMNFQDKLTSQENHYDNEWERERELQEMYPDEEYIDF